jgi:hypothetical protein
VQQPRSRALEARKGITRLFREGQEPGSSSAWDYYGLKGMIERLNWNQC